MKSFLIDASVAIKWVIDEEGTREALALRGDRLSAPDLLTAECANILWKKARRHEISSDEAGFAARLIARADIDLIPMRSLMEDATRIAVFLDHPAYDCIYLAAAEAASIPFVTADERLLRKLRQEPTGRFATRVLGLTEACATR